MNEYASDLSFHWTRSSPHTKITSSAAAQRARWERWKDVPEISWLFGGEKAQMGDCGTCPMQKAREALEGFVITLFLVTFPFSFSSYPSETCKRQCKDNVKDNGKCKK